MNIILDSPAVVRYFFGAHALDIYCMDGKIALASWLGQKKGTQGVLRGRLAHAQNLASAGVCEEAALWIEQYRSGAAIPPVSLDWFFWPKEASGFRIDVWKTLAFVPHGSTATYLDIAKLMGRRSESARCVASAIGDNPFSPFIPCHRVIGGDGSLTGFAAGLEIKIMLLRHEHANPPQTACARAREKFFREIDCCRSAREAANGYLGDWPNGASSRDRAGSFVKD